MNKYLSYITIVLIIFNGCSSDKNIRKDIPEEIEVYIEQNGNRINITDNTAEIRRTKFSIVFKFSQPDSVLLNASFLPETFNNAREGLPLNELSGFKNTGVSDDLFNKDNLLYVSSDSPNFWYYTDDTDHRFSSVLKSESGFVCTREISSIIDMDGTGEKTDITQIRQKEIYLVIIKSDWNADYTRMIERSRKILKLKFII